MAETITSVDAYIAARPSEVRPILVEIRRVIARAVPGAGEKMSYQLPTVTADGSPLMYFAAWKKHIGIYPIPPLDEELETRVAPYRSGQDSLKFPLCEAIPYDLIEAVAGVLGQRRAEADRDRTSG